TGAREKWIADPLPQEFAPGFAPYPGGTARQHHASQLLIGLGRAPAEADNDTDADARAKRRAAVDKVLGGGGKAIRVDLPELVDDVPPEQLEELSAVALAAAQVKAEGAFELLLRLA